nr:hypothetical protein CFP56_09916 [Quercus suber]
MGSVYRIMFDVRGLYGGFDLDSRSFREGKNPTRKSSWIASFSPATVTVRRFELTAALVHRQKPSGQPSTGRQKDLRKGERSGMSRLQTIAKAT